MLEVQLEDFEEFYKEKINYQFFKTIKVSKKIISDIRNNLIGIKITMDHFLDSSERIESKSKKSLKLFSERIKASIDEIEIPEEEITYDNLNDLLNSIKKLLRSIHEIARRSLPKFQKEVQSEIKELDYRTRKLGKKQVILDKFLLTKYTDLKNAEDLLNKLPKLFSLKTNIENAKSDLSEFETEVDERQKKLEKLNSELITLEKNDLFKKLENEQEKLFKLRIKINDEIGFKKALKKLKFELDKETIHIANLDFNYLKNFLKDPISTLKNESKDLPNFSALLVHLRHILEEGKLNLKADTKDKTIVQINNIFEEKTMHSYIDELKGLNENINKIQNEIKEAGLSTKLEDIKNQISFNAAKLEHIQNDLERKNKDYLKYLGTLKQERENFQKFVERVIHEGIKISITFIF